MSPHEDRLSDFNRDSRILKISFFAAIIGVISAAVAYGLLWLIRMMTNLAFFQDFSGSFRSPAEHHLGFFVVGIPIIGGLVIGLMARRKSAVTESPKLWRPFSSAKPESQSCLRNYLN